MGSNFENTRAVLESLGKTKEAGILSSIARFAGGARPPRPSPQGISWKTIAQLGALGTGVAAAGGIAAEGVEAGVEKVKAKRNFKRMLASNPDLRKNTAQIKPYFRALMHFSPMVAGDPLAAGSFVRRMHDFEDAGFPLQDVETLSRIQGARGNQGAGAVIRGATAKGIGLSKKL